MKRKTIFCLLALALAFCLALSGCGGDSKESTKPADPQTPAQQGSSQPAAPPATNEKDPKPGKESTPGTEGMGDRLAKAYSDILDGDKYYMKTRVHVDGQFSDTETANDGDNFATRVLAQGVENRFVTKGNTMYVIDSASRTVTIMSNEENGDGDAEDIDYGGLAFVKEGQRDFLGKTLPYEEYSEDGLTVTYFFQGKALAGIETNVEDNILRMEVLELSKNIPSGIFDIPKDYQQMDMRK